MAMIDHGVVTQLVVGLLRAGLDASMGIVTLLVPGDPDPEPDLGATPMEEPLCTVRLLAIDLSPHSTPRANTTEADHAAIADMVVTLVVTCPPAVTKVSFGAISQVLGLVAASLGGETARDVATTHQIDFEAQPHVSTDPVTDEQRKELTGAVIATGTVVRTSGRSVGAFVT